MNIKIINKSEQKLPEYTTERSAGMDLRANIPGVVLIKPMERILINTGLFIELLDGFEAQISPGSGLAIKHGISILNSPGIIEPDYRGEVCIIPINLSKEKFIVYDGDRTGQMKNAKHERIKWTEVKVFKNSTRGEGGFGHTGKN